MLNKNFFGVIPMTSFLKMQKTLAEYLDVNQIIFDADIMDRIRSFEI